MTDISVTAASVLKTANTQVDRQGYAGETITAGQAVYLSPATGKWVKADADAANAAIGIALSGASDGQPLSVARSGDLTFNAVLTANTEYYLSSTAGGICPKADVGAGEYQQQIGTATSTTNMRLSLLSTGVQN